MSKRATLILAAITAVVLAFILVYERNTLSSGELESRRGQVLDRFVRPRVTELTLQRGESVVVTLVRDQEAEETLDTFDVGTWRLTAPVASAADPDAIDGVLQACEMLSARRTLDHVSDEDRRNFGLEEPRFVLTMRVADESIVLRVGGDDEGTDAVYVEVAGTDRVQLVGRDFFEALDHDTDHFRSKELFPDLASRDVTRVVLRQGSEEARLESREDRWVATTPFEGWARRSTLEALFDALVDVRVTRFVGDEALVSAPVLSVELTVRERDAEGLDTGRTREAALVVGAPCPPSTEAPPEGQSAPELIAARVDEQAVVCVPRASLENLFGAMATLRETRLIAASEDQVERIELHASFGGSDMDLEVRREEGDWDLVQGTSERPADEQAVAEFVRALRAQEAESFEPASPENLAARGLDTPRARIRAHRSDVSFIESIDVGSLDTVGVWVRRGDEPVIARYVGDAVELLAPSALRFRSRELVGREADDVLRVAVVRGGVEERLSTENGAWRIEAPHALAADRVATRDLVRMLATLRATRWVAEGASPVHGLETPRIRARLELREATASPEDDEHAHEGEPGETTPEHVDATALPTSIELLVGAATEGGAFARLSGEPAVFVLATEVVDALAQPLVDREILGVDTATATRIVVRSAASTVELERVDGRWLAAGAPAAPDATEAFLERLRSLRARGVVGYGGEAAFSAPTLIVEVTSPAGTSRLEIGATSGEGEAGWAHARRSDVPVDFQLSVDVVRALAGYRP